MSTDILLVVQGCSYAVTIGKTPEACNAVVVIELNYTINIKIMIMMRQDYISSMKVLQMAVLLCDSVCMYCN